MRSDIVLSRRSLGWALFLGFASSEMCEREPQERPRLRTRRGCYANDDPSDRHDRDSEESSGLDVLLDVGERVSLRRVLEKRVAG